MRQEGITTRLQRGQSLGQIARAHRISRTTVGRVLREQTSSSPVPKGLEKPAC